MNRESRASSEPAGPGLVVVVGAGAAGLVAAAEAAAAGARVVLLEKQRRPGLKILISGGGHCNVTTSLEPHEALQCFGARGARFLRHAVRQTPPARIRAWLHERAVPTMEATYDKVWPVSRRASDVLDALLDRAKDAGVELRVASAVRSIKAAAGKSGLWQVEVENDCLVCSQLILATGGLSYPKTGTTGDGYRWLRSLGLPLVEPRPALAPLRSPATWVHDLAGLTLEHVEVQLREQSGRIVWRRRRPLLFTHRGVSGPGPMDASGRIEREPGRYRLCVDLLPERSEEEVRGLLFQGKLSLLNRLSRGLGIPRRLASSLLGRLDCETAASQLPKNVRRSLLQELKGMHVPVSGSLGFAHAELSSGGVVLEAVDPKSMQVRAFPGLYVTGELLDVDGPIGGFSFLSAFATGVLAGRAAAAAALNVQQVPRGKA